MENSSSDLLLTPEQVREKLLIDGFALQSQLFSHEQMDELICSFEMHSSASNARIHEGDTYAWRNVLHSIPNVERLAKSEQLLGFVKSILGEGARAVRATLFDKTEKTNWNLRWHQDNVIAVKEKIDLPAYHGWSEKLGVPHVRPPVEVLEEMLAARVHLDPCPAGNGALKVVAQSHLRGRLEPKEAAQLMALHGETLCAAGKGDVLYMKPLLLHASERSQNPSHRRVLHIEYSALILPAGLEWSDA